MSDKGSNKETDKTKKRLIILIAAGIVVLLAAAYLVLCQAAQDQGIWENTSVNGVGLKGLTIEEAEEAVQQKFVEDYQDAAVTVTLEGQDFQIPIYSVLKMDASDEIRAAYETGHGSWITRGLDWLRTRLGGGGKNLEVIPTVDSGEALDQAIADSGILDYGSAVESTWEATDTELIIHKGTSGVAPDPEQLRAAVQEALENHNLEEKIDCPTREQQPQTPDFQQIADSIYKDPVNASLDAANNYAVTASATGLSLDASQAQAAYDAAAEGTDVTVPLTITQPSITTEALNANLFKDVLGTYQSSVTGDSGKKTNISLAVNMCNGIILLPGETFSYNGIIGETSPEQGFQMANVYQDGEVVQEPGGGVCQVSSTIFSALLYTDLEVVQRQNHSMIVNYVPRGMDATVYWDQPDFRFKNNHAYPIKLSLSFENNVITVQIIGTKESDLTVDCRVEQTGDMVYDTYRDYYDAGGNLVNSEYVCHSEYKPVS